MYKKAGNIMISLLVAGQLCLAGCTAPTMSSKAKLIKEADESMVKKCKFLGSVDDKGYGMFTDAAREACKINLFNRTAELNANRIVIRDTNCVHDSTSVAPYSCTMSARAYLCK